MVPPSYPDKKILIKNFAFLGFWEEQKSGVIYHLNNM